MNNTELQQRLTSATRALSDFIAERGIPAREEITPVLAATAEDLQRGLYLLLPPRAGSSATCPHCKKSITLS
jgi:hypothetical protein